MKGEDIQTIIIFGAILFVIIIVLFFLIHKRRKTIQHNNSIKIGVKPPSPAQETIVQEVDTEKTNNKIIVSNVSEDKTYKMLKFKPICSHCKSPMKLMDAGFPIEHGSIICSNCSTEFRYTILGDKMELISQGATGLIKQEFRLKEIVVEPENRIDDLILSIKNDKITKAYDLLNIGVDPYEISKTSGIEIAGYSAFTFAVKKGNMKLVKTILEKGSDIESRSKALYIAADEGHLNIVDIILNKGVDIDIKLGFLGETPFAKACGRWFLDIAKLLLDHNANVNVKDKFGCTALAALCSNAFGSSYRAKKDTVIELVKLLIDVGIDINVKDEDGNTALMYASGNNFKEGVELLLKSGADVNAQNNKGQTALIIASKECGLEAFELLLSAGADVTKRDVEGQTALEIAENHPFKEVHQAHKDSPASRANRRIIELLKNYTK
jgi:ankyrin repeat protein